MYILIHIRLCGRVSDKKLFIWPISGNKIIIIFLKDADVTPVFKKNNPLNKENYRPVSVLLIISKVFEKLMQNQINLHIKCFLSPYLRGYRKGFIGQHVLISLIERRRRKSLDNKGYGGPVLMDL